MRNPLLTILVVVVALFLLSFPLSAEGLNCFPIYPKQLGGTTGETVYNAIDVTSSMNLMMGGYSKDPKLVSTASLRGILIYLGSNGIYIWAKFLSVSQSVESVKIYGKN